MTQFNFLTSILQPTLSVLEVLILIVVVLLLCSTIAFYLIKNVRILKLINIFGITTFILSLISILFVIIGYLLIFNC